MWEPRFACPECRGALGAHAEEQIVCSRCGERFEHSGGVYVLLASDRKAAKEAFFRQYRAVREADGFRATSPDYYRSLPCVGRDDPHAAEWRIRQESLGELIRCLSERLARDVCVLDLGAGSGWLSNRLAERGHRAVAVDAFDDEVDGLRARANYSSTFCAVQADFDALPFEPRQFSLVVFNASLHYAPDPAATLAEGRRMLADGGFIAVMDSPMFEHEREGRAMVANQADAMKRRCQLSAIERPGPGYLTFAGLHRAARDLGLEDSFAPSRGPITWRLRRLWSQRRLRRAPAAFGVWIAQ